MVENPIKRIRERAGLTRLEFAKRTGMSHGSLTGLEMGMNRTIRPKTLEPIRKVCKVNIDELRKEYATWRELQQQAA